MKVLDYTGLQNLWTNIKNYITAHTPTSTSELTNDSGFLTSTDISSKANDSEVVHKAQNETVTGEKTFKKDVKIIDLNANERPGVQFEVNGSFITFEQAKDALPDTDFGDFGVGTVWSAFWLNDNTKIQNSMSDYVINDITFGTTGVGSVIEFNNYYKVKYEEADNIQTDLRGMLRFELVPYAGVQKDSMMWTNPKLYFYAKLDNDEFGDTILGHEDARWSKAYIDEINCYEIKFGGNSIRDILEHIISLSYVTHYSSTALTSNSTNSLSIIDNQDSVKVGDKVIDSSGVIYSVTAIDTANSTFTIGTSLIDLAQDSDVVHNSGDETVGGKKTFSDDLTIYNPDTTAYAKYLNLKNQKNARGSSETGSQGVQYQDKYNKTLTMLESRVVSNGNTSFNIICYNIDGNNQVVSDGVSVIKSPTITNFAPTTDNAVTCGRTLAKWSDVQTYKVNGVEPSSLSLPSDRSARIDISAYFTNTGSGYTNDYIVPANGYILLNLTNVKAVTCYSLDSQSITNFAQSYQRSDDGQIYAFFPVRKNDKFRTLWYSTGGTVTVTGAYFIPCLGNV